MHHGSHDELSPITADTEVFIAARKCRRLVTQGDSPPIKCQDDRMRGNSMPDRSRTPDDNCGSSDTYLLSGGLQMSASMYASKSERFVSITDVMACIGESRRIVVIVGAGLSVSCGIPDFRSATGLYSTLQSLNLPVAEPEDLLDIATFDDTPELFYSFASRIWPCDSIKPSLGHNFLNLLHTKRKLLRIYTQNVDGLESVAGIPRAKVIECHGTMQTARCRKCKRPSAAKALEADVANGQIPYCPRCRVAVMKPDITFFGEAVSARIEKCVPGDAEKADLILVMGTSLAVAPVSTLLDRFPRSVPRFLVNRNLVAVPSQCTTGFTLALLGDIDATVHHVVGCLLINPFVLFASYATAVVQAYAMDYSCALNNI
eukprot:m.1197731 g.1197731  ORF g.1197731 m.1197731 type:complete len:374 (+) comp24568_c1_seq1:173-1294(+)